MLATFHADLRALRTAASSIAAAIQQARRPAVLLTGTLPHTHTHTSPDTRLPRRSTVSLQRRRAAAKSCSSPPAGSPPPLGSPAASRARFPHHILRLPETPAASGLSKYSRPKQRRDLPMPPGWRATTSA